MADSVDLQLCVESPSSHIKSFLAGLTSPFFLPHEVGCILSAVANVTTRNWGPEVCVQFSETSRVENGDCPTVGAVAGQTFVSAVNVTNSLFQHENLLFLLKHKRCDRSLHGNVKQQSKHRDRRTVSATWKCAHVNLS